MANNRMYLLHRPSGETLFLGKRMGTGWYRVNDLSESKANEFFDKCEAVWNKATDLDDFVLVMEDTGLAPHLHEGTPTIISPPRNLMHSRKTIEKKAP